MHLGFPFSVFPILLCLLSRVTITCRDFCELWYLHKPLLDVIFLQFPKIKRNIHRHVYDAGLELGSILSADKLKYTVPFKKSLVASSNFRSLSMVYSEDGTLLPSRSLIDVHDDPVRILRWSFLVVRILRRIYSVDTTIRIYNSLMSFGSKVWGDISSGDSEQDEGRLFSSSLVS